MQYTIPVENKLIISEDWGSDLIFYTGDVKMITRKILDTHVFHGSLNLFCDDPARNSYFIPHGKGVLYTDIDNKIKYGDVNFIDGILHGHCTIYDDKTDCIMYEGDFKNNKPDGFGKLYNHSVKDNEYVIYEGDWKDGMRSGVGYSHEYVSEIYDGEWENNMRNGYGQHFMDNQIISCIWKDNKKNGYGQIELVDKGHYMINCKWKDDKIVEPGIEVIPVRKSKRTNN